MNPINLREINRLALPAILAGIAEPLIGLADTAIIGQLGETAQGGVGLASSFFSLLVWFLFQAESAMTAIVAKHYGQRTLDSIQSLIPQALLLSVGLGFFCLGLSYPFAEEIFTIYNAKDELLDVSVIYFQTRVLGFPFTVATLAIVGVFRGIQNTSWAMRMSVVGGVVNLLLDLLLVFGIEGWFEGLGVQGAALASLGAQVTMFGMAIVFLLRKTDFKLHLTFPFHPEVKTMIGMSGNLFIRVLALNLAFFFANRYSTGYGDEHIAAHTIAMNIWLFSSFFIDGYAHAGQALGGRLLGGGDFKELYRIGIQLLKINVLIATGLALLYLAGYPILGSLFSNKAEVIELFDSIFWLLIISQPINAIAFTFDGLLKGMGKMVLLRNTQLIATFVGFLPALLLLDYLGWELKAVWVAFLVFMIFRGVPLWFDFQRYRNT